MNTLIYENLDIEDFHRFFETLKKQHPEISGAEWNKETKVLKLFSESDAWIMDYFVRNLKLPTVLRFRKKINVPIIQNAIVTAINENEFTVETDDPESVKKEIRKTFSEFEEVKL